MSANLRIASLLASATEIVYALGLGEQLVGVSHECDFPSSVRKKPRLTRSHVDSDRGSLQIDQQVSQVLAAGQSLYEIDERLLVELAPDLIITQAQCDVCAIRYEDVMSLVRREPLLERTGVVALSPSSLEDVFEDILRVGRATRQPHVAASCVDRLQGRVDRVRQRVADLSDAQRPRVACVEWVEPLMIAANWTPQLVELAGGKNGLSEAGKHSQYVAWEQLVAYDPEVLVLIPCGFDLPRTLQEVAGMPRYEGWMELQAVRQGRVVAIDGNAYFNRSGPRLVDSLEILARVLHPTRFEPPETSQENPQGVWTMFTG